MGENKQRTSRKREAAIKDVALEASMLLITIRHDVARHVDYSYLAKLVVTQCLKTVDAFGLAFDLTSKLLRQAYRIDK